VPIEWPILIASGIGLKYATALEGTGGDAGDQAGSLDAPMTDPTQVTDGAEFFGWRAPMDSWEGYAPVISQAYKRPDHHGVDVMYRRVPGGGPDQRFARGTSQGTPMFFCPDGQRILAPRSGYLWSAGLGPTGHYVVISCAKPIAVFLVHMRSLSVPFVDRGAGRIPIAAGQELGIVGYSPKDGQKLNHLHLEIWRGGGSSSHVDPAPYLKGILR
jgi:murein DD-endopeptidase MepM/ murein hydrolase activator NlpD